MANNGPWSFQSEYFGSWLSNTVTTGVGRTRHLWPAAAGRDGSGASYGFGTRLAFDF